MKFVCLFVEKNKKDANDFFGFFDERISRSVSTSYRILSRLDKMSIFSKYILSINVSKRKLGVTLRKWGHLFCPLLYGRIKLKFRFASRAVLMSVLLSYIRIRKENQASYV